MFLEVDPYWTIDENDPRLVHVARTSEPFPGLEAIAPSYEALLSRLDAAGRAEKAIIIDFRGGPAARNDDAFEAATLPYRPRLFEGYAAGGVLVMTAAGRMQLTRTSRQDAGAYVVSSDEQELRAHLTRQLDATP